jgi:hypothetical protein
MAKRKHNTVLKLPDLEQSHDTGLPSNSLLWSGESGLA